MQKDAANTKVVVAMSGGVDSSTACAMMHERGFDVIGITLQLYDQGAMANKKGACCAGQDIYDASLVAAKLNIPHYVLDYESKFKTTVIDDFVDSYLQGQTPLPCVRCNQSVKFTDLIKFATSLNADYLVTGHYVQKIITNGKSELHKGLDLNKDQSYFLFATTKQQLDFLQFPLGGMTKEQTRLEAKRFGLITADKPDSQDICFVPNGSYVDLIKKMRPDALQDGSIMHIDGYEVGRHQGIAGYTIGQRRGLKISSPEALYVIRIDPNKNTIYVGPEKALNANSLIINDINWLAEDSIPKDGLEVEVKIRSAHRGSMAKIYNIDNNSILVKLLNYEKAITPGQACVIYDGTRVLGGGWIVKEENLSNL